MGWLGACDVSDKVLALRSMSPEQLQKKIESLAPGTQVQVMDLTGTQDHYQVVVISSAFEGKRLIEQQRMVMGLLKPEVDSGEVHALTMRTFTPEQYAKL